MEALCAHCLEVRHNSCSCSNCKLCCNCTTSNVRWFFKQFEKDMALIRRCSPKGTKDIDPNFAFLLYVGGHVERETPWDAVYEIPGSYTWVSRDYERLSWCTIKE